MLTGNSDQKAEDQSKSPSTTSLKEIVFIVQILANFALKTDHQWEIRSGAQIASPLMDDISARIGAEAVKTFFVRLPESLKRWDFRSLQELSDFILAPSSENSGMERYLNQELAQFKKRVENLPKATVVANTKEDPCKYQFCIPFVLREPEAVVSRNDPQKRNRIIAELGYLLKKKILPFNIKPESSSLMMIQSILEKLPRGKSIALFGVNPNNVFNFDPDRPFAGIHKIEWDPEKMAVAIDLNIKIPLEVQDAKDLANRLKITGIADQQFFSERPGIQKATKELRDYVKKMEDFDQDAIVLPPEPEKPRGGRREDRRRQKLVPDFPFTGIRGISVYNEQADEKFASPAGFPMACQTACQTEAIVGIKVCLPIEFVDACMHGNEYKEFIEQQSNPCDSYAAAAPDTVVPSASAGSSSPPLFTKTILHLDSKGQVARCVQVRTTSLWDQKQFLKATAPVIHNSSDGDSKSIDQENVVSIQHTNSGAATSTNSVSTDPSKNGLNSGNVPQLSRDETTPKAVTQQKQKDELASNPGDFKADSKSLNLDRNTVGISISNISPKPVVSANPASADSGNIIPEASRAASAQNEGTQQENERVVNSDNIKTDEKGGSGKCVVAPAVEVDQKSSNTTTSFAGGAQKNGTSLYSPVPKATRATLASREAGNTPTAKAPPVLRGPTVS